MSLPASYDTWRTASPPDGAADVCGNCRNTREEHETCVINGATYLICPETWELVTGGAGTFEEASGA